MSKYVSRVNELLRDGLYTQLKQDPSPNELKTIRSAIKTSKLFYNCFNLIPSVSHCARFYALPKVHKIGVPLRPIVSNIRTASYGQAKFLTSRFAPLLDSNTHSVKHSVDFVNILRRFKPNNLLMVSFDDKSLFTNVPVIGALRCLETRLREFHHT
ncbi:uncharacterized protein LOC129216422 [Uloborus diversus]|uniref:uncharacterized protein LOC129216422 n=1 Tax=Uloborus diversus TaxID=327109 RepID=UPI0024097992|nr:uncharacterized protein LOC129216422 [Uloborus diversus]